MFSKIFNVVLVGFDNVSSNIFQILVLFENMILHVGSIKLLRNHTFAVQA